MANEQSSSEPETDSILVLNFPWRAVFPKATEHPADNSAKGKICTRQNKDMITMISLDLGPSQRMSVGKDLILPNDNINSTV